MIENAAQNTRCPDELTVFTFSLMGIAIGVDADQIAEVLEVSVAESRGMTLIRFHEIISFGDLPVAYLAPKAVTLKNVSVPYALVVDRPDDIAVVSMNSIRSMPPLIRGRNESRAVWGAIVNKDTVVLLVDLYKLIA